MIWFGWLSWRGVKQKQSNQGKLPGGAECFMTNILWSSFWHTVPKARPSSHINSASCVQISCICCMGVTHLLHTATRVTAQPSQANPRAGSEQQHSQQMGRGPCQHTGHRCDDLRVTCTAQQAICSRFGPDGAFQGVILVLTNGNNHAWLSQVHRSLWRTG